VTWVITAYTLCFGGLMPPGGRMADALGRRRIFLMVSAVDRDHDLARPRSQPGARLGGHRWQRAAVGVLLGGLLRIGPGWEWVFFINVPVGALVAIALPTWSAATRPRRGAASMCQARSRPPPDGTADLRADEGR
jgi:MFS family permease